MARIDEFLVGTTREQETVVVPLSRLLLVESTFDGSILTLEGGARIHVTDDIISLMTPIQEEVAVASDGGPGEAPVTP